VAEIVTTIDHVRDVTVRTVRGPVAASDILAAVAAITANGPPTRHSVWDFSGATVDHLTPHDLQAIATAALPALALRPGGRTALVLPSQSAFGMGRMYSLTLDAKGGAVTHDPFHDLDSALAWLAEG
jgi:hypothetical protein